MNETLIKMACSIFVLVVMTALTWSVRRVFRFRRPLRVSASRREDLHLLAKRIDRQTLLPLLILLIVCPFLVTVILDQLAGLWIARLPGTVYLMDMVTPRATWLKWAMPSGVVYGFCLFWWLCTVLLIRIYGRQVIARYIVYGKLRYKLDYVRATNACLSIAAALCLPFTLLEFGWYTRVQEDAFVINDYWGLGEKRYTFDQVDKIVKTTHLATKTGKVVERSRYFIIFSDGSEWCMDPAFSDYQPIMQFVSEKSGKPIRTVQWIEEARGG